MSWAGASELQVPGDAVLAKASDVVQLVFSRSAQDEHILQFGQGGTSIIFNEGGPLVWAVLELCDGSRRVSELTAELQATFAGPDSLWSDDLPQLLSKLLDWRVLESVSVGHGDGSDVLG